MSKKDSVYAIKFAVMQHQINEKDKRIKELEETNKKYIIQLTDEQYRNLVDIIRKEVKQEFEQKVKEELERAEKENEPYEEYEIESRMYWINQGKISLANKLLEENNMLKEFVPKQKIKEVTEKIINYKIPRATNDGYYYDYFVNQDYKEDFIKLFNQLLEDK